MDDTIYDVAIVGAGISGALIANRLTNAGLRVLVLEAGPATAWTFDGYSAHLDHFYEAAGKGPESAWPPAVGGAAAGHRGRAVGRRLLRPAGPGPLR